MSEDEHEAGDVRRRDLERAAFGPGGTTADRRALAGHLEGRRIAAADAALRSTARRRPSRVPKVAVVVGGIIVVLVVASTALAVSWIDARPRHALSERAWRPAVMRVLASKGRLAPAAVYRRDRSRLPSGWRDNADPTSFTELGGARPVAVTVPRNADRLLLAVACDSSDRSFQWTVDGIVGFGACGRLAPVVVELVDGHAARLEIDIVTRGVTPFSFSVWTASPSSG